MTNQNSKTNETERIEQSQKPITSKLALLSLVLPVLGFCMSLYFVISRDESILSWHPFYIIWWLSAIVGFVLGIVALVKIGNSNGRIAGRVLATLGISVAVISFIFSNVCRLITPVKRPPPLMICRSHLHRLGMAMRIYADDFDGKYPPAEKWCDLLVQYGGIVEKQFVCRSALRGGDKGRCHYAMNPNCEPNSPEDVVLLFETKSGWNQYGGPEMVTFENHEGNGCNVLLKDGRVEFVTPKEVGKLKWK
ncbi:MAG: DUF4190 domain-containing protein [Planctomycetota bacterium]|nr:DUF4190 domain-containing protein [Planctomycetota bacterium]